MLVELLISFGIALLWMLIFIGTISAISYLVIKILMFFNADTPCVTITAVLIVCAIIFLTVLIYIQRTGGHW